MTVSRARSIVVVSHRRSGTHLAIDSILNNLEPFRSSRSPVVNLDRITSRSLRPLSVEALRRCFESGPCVFKTHTHPDIEAFFDRDAEKVRLLSSILSSSFVIYVHRDGRDVMTSLFHYVSRHVNPECAAMTCGSFLRMFNEFDAETYAGDLGRVEYWKRHVEGWLDDDRRAACVPYEALYGDLTSCLQQLARGARGRVCARIINVKRTRVGGSPLSRRLHERWLRMRHLLGGPRYTAVAFRRGAIGDHRGWFTPADLSWFDDIAGSTLVRLGYASLKGDPS